MFKLKTVTKTPNLILLCTTAMYLAALNTTLYGQTCVLAEPPSSNCPSARVIDGNPGQHVVLMDVSTVIGVGLLQCQCRPYGLV